MALESEKEEATRPPHVASQTKGSNDYSGLISFKMDLLDHLAVQGTLKSLFNTTIKKHQFFSAQLSL